ncbi:PQQ-like beta-propeller repeat protein [Telmatocola sphagniphila]|uniref:PQQ-like beta-propeller repeat protein n=1 Tax=Telmatocola sphagniphila TaxID=1123043 RepID=A0A8E6B2S4_9BACT|nr:PQQ-binding-like beta-propeller repeat protein [Telmatocola sphagniphila]QVL31080.1 PQQ-like beta-propeller repeat protein [Telmatocola sphagniphila]
MKNALRNRLVVLGVMLTLGTSPLHAQDWTQWRGPDRNNKVSGFTEPKTWPKNFTEKWKVTVGVGDASPVLMGDKVYAYGRIGKKETLFCLDATTGKELWKDAIDAPDVRGPASGHPGPRSSPAAADGKVCTFGVDAVLTCYEADSGKILWRKETKGHPRFFTSSSPLIVDKMCIIHTGSEGKGALTAFNLADGKEVWAWNGDGPSYSSPVVMTVAGTKQIVEMTEKNIVGISAADGKLLWETPFKARYNNSTPLVDGDTVIYGAPGVGTIASKITKEGDKFTVKELWKKSQAPHNYNSPTLKDGFIYGLSPSKNFYCMNAKTGEIVWTDTNIRGECGVILDAGSVMLSLPGNTDLVAFKPNDKEYQEVAKIKVADTATWTCPIVAGKKIFVKDKDTLRLLTIED